MSDHPWTRFTGEQSNDVPTSIHLPPAPPWRRFDVQHKGKAMRPQPKAVEMVNIAMYLRRPLLLTGKPGTGKSSLAYCVAEELGLVPLLHWAINTRSTLAEGLYRYDALARLRDVQAMRYQQQTSSEPTQTPSETAQDIANYIDLGPLGTALIPADTPRVLLIDEIDKSDIDLPNDLLHVFEDGWFEIPELAPQRLAVDAENPQDIIVDIRANDGRLVKVTNGRVQCREFPLVIMTSNGERDFPPAFLRRCLRLKLELPSAKELADIVRSHVGDEVFTQSESAMKREITEFIKKREDADGDLATDQLLNLIYFLSQDIQLNDDQKNILLQKLNAGV